MMDIDKNRMMEYAYDLRSDLKHAFEEGEGQTPNRKDVQVMDWLIEQALKVRTFEDSRMINAKEDYPPKEESITAVATQEQYDMVVEILGYTPKNLVVNQLLSRKHN